MKDQKHYFGLFLNLITTNILVSLEKLIMIDSTTFPFSPEVLSVTIIYELISTCKCSC